MSGSNDMPAPETGEVAAGADQSETIAFLGSGEAFGGDIEVERHETHGAMVFLGGDIALKIKRAVHYAYMDFSSLDKRHAALEREFAINRGNAPELYIGVEPIVRAAGGGLRLGGEGEVVEWALRMKRFPQSALLSRRLADGLDAAGLKEVADEVVRSHADAPVVRGVSGVDALEAIIAEITGALGADSATAADAEVLRRTAVDRLRAVRRVIEKRAAVGMVRRCHGDLHLDNIVVIEGRPRLFDAIEFDEALATIDTLYDLAFLLMDLDAHGYRAGANQVLNRYLWKRQDTLDLEGLAALPLFLALRAGVRAMVARQRAALSGGEPEAEVGRAAGRYLGRALQYSMPPPAGLVAIGGLSGTGKSTLAARLSPLLGPAPGAVHLRSDLERKALHGVDEFTRLPDDAYSAEESLRVYSVLADKACTALRAGHAVVVDAVFSSPVERKAIEQLAGDCGVPFAGLWLETGTDELIARVEARTKTRAETGAGDASDATAAVVQRQVARGVGEVGWEIVDASGAVEDVLERASVNVRRIMPAVWMPAIWRDGIASDRRPRHSSEA